MNLKDKTLNLIHDISGFELINDKSRLTEELGLDSLDMVSLLIDIEEMFDIKLNESDFNLCDLEDVSDVVDLVERHM